MVMGMQMDIGVQRTVVIEDAALARDVFKNPALNGRQDDASAEVSLPSALALPGGELGAVQNFMGSGWGLFFLDDGKRLRLSRKNGIRALSLFSSAKNEGLSAAVVKAVDAFKGRLDKLAGQPLNPRPEIFQVTPVS